MRQEIRKVITGIEPSDGLEALHRERALAWIDSGEEIFRIQKPATPPKHLVSYFVVVDPLARKVLFVNHINAGLWLPPGGHVEKDEHPHVAVEREVREELFMDADFVFDDPLFITETLTVGTTAGHTDVSLWYVLRADSTKELHVDPHEFADYRWFGYGEVFGIDSATLDPHTHRFMKKFLQRTGVSESF